MNSNNFRYCVFSRKKIKKGLLYKISYDKKSKTFYFNKNNFKARSVYFLKDSIKNKKIKNICELLLSRLKIENNLKNIEMIKSFLKDGDLIHE